MALGRPLGAKLLLEGIEVPLIGATITSTVNQASIAYIDVVPQADINDIKPRTQVVLAMRDYNDAENDYPYVSAWEGEVYGYSFGKQVGGRSFSISAIDYTGYWDNVLCYFFDAQQSLGKAGIDQVRAGLEDQAAQQQGIQRQATNGSTTSYFLQIINDVLADSSKNFLDAFVSVYKNISNVNDFYNAAEARLRIIDRILLNSTGKLQNLLAQAEGKEWFSGIIGKSGGYQTLRGVVQDLMSLIFHDFVPVPFPARVGADKLSGPGLQSTSNTTSTIGSFIFKPNLYMIPPPLCNVFFPDEYSSFQYSRNFFKEPTRLIYMPELPQFRTGQSLALGYSYMPDSFENFMNGSTDWATYISQDKQPLDVDADPGHYNDTDNGPYAVSNNSVKREGQFLTNEERVKGIFIAQESIMPATTQFQGDLASGGKPEFIKNIARYLFYKKRFESRQLQITSHLKMSVVPGFNVLILDDSDAQQTVVAYCSSVTHRIYATEGGYTNVTLSYARTVDEQTASNSTSGEPIVPPWFSEEIFGAQQFNPPSGVAASDLKALKEVLVTPATGKLSDFYKGLLGGKGSKALTDYNVKEPTLVGAVAKLLKDYRERRSKGSEDLQTFIASVTARDYIRLRDAMGFLGSSTASKDLRTDNFVEFTGGAYDSANGQFGSVVAARQVPVKLYRTSLMTQRGFRG